jgi:hypothetical protein
LRAFENEVRGGLLLRRSFSDPAKPLDFPSLTSATTGPDASAGAVVEYLLRETDLLQLAYRDSLTVSVGAGNWISWSFQLHPGTIDPARTISRLWNGSGKLSFRRCWSGAGESAWYRSKGAPSLHFEVVSSASGGGSQAFVQGHVDAANPWSHPLKHFIADYLPAAGIGTHPDPGEMLNSSLHRRT